MRTAKRTIGLALALLSMDLAWAGAPAAAPPLVMGCTQSASSHYAYCVGAVKAISARSAGVQVSVMETGGGVENIRRMVKGEVDFGLGTPDTFYLAWKGEGSWNSTPVPDARVLWIHTVSANYFVVREDSGVRTPADLAGKRFVPGVRGSGGEVMHMQILDVLGVKPEWARMGTAEAVDAVKDRHVVGYAKAGSGFSLDPSTLDIATTTPVRVLPFTEAQMKAAKARYPHSLWVKVPAGSIKGLGEFWTTAAVVGVIGSTRLPVDLGYRIVKAVIEGREHQAAVFKGTAPDIAGLTLEQALSPLHAGTVRYLREKGLAVPDHLVPPEAR